MAFPSLQHLLRNEEHHELLVPSSSLAHTKRAFSGIEPPNQSRKVSESPRLYDVFINHRGPDVKNTLALELYKSLEKLNIRAFLDSKELELGDSLTSAIKTAIHSAAVHIAIFSKGYAESPWCLEELLLMLRTRAKIIPVFHHVKPSALRHIEKGAYANAFAQYHEKARYLEKLDEWKAALQSVSFIAGEEFNSWSDCNKIVSAVQKEVGRTKSIIVAKYPVGLPKLVEDFEKQCVEKAVQDFEHRCGINKAGEGKGKIIGIFGMGGVGKTTLSKALFNRKRLEYNRSSFLFDVREASAERKMPSLQMKLLRDLFDEDHQSFTCVEEGSNCLRDRIRRSDISNFLIVVDDIDHLKQLDALLISDMVEKFSSCLVIVTTRDVGVLINAGITVGYHLKGMDNHDAKELFCWHAFGQADPYSGYEELVDLFVHVCHGLPLCIEVLGSHVHGYDRKFWELELKKVKKTLPQDILKTLRISIEALDNEEKQIFMDVACFFIGELTRKAMRVWDASGWSSQHALLRLKNKSLVGEDIREIREVRDWRENVSVLIMHDHLRDLGREMANEVFNPPRLYRTQHLQSLELEELKNIISQPKLRYFHSFVDLSVGFQIKYFLGKSNNTHKPSTDLLWLEVEDRCHIIPDIPEIWIPFQNLQCLKVTGRYFASLRLNGLSQTDIQAPVLLKELVLHRIAGLQELSLGFLVCLETLEICSCRRLKRVTGISDLTHLVELNIIFCVELEFENLSFHKLSCIKVIRIHRCRRLESVTGISGLGMLEELNIIKCGKLEFEESSFCHLRCLKKVTIQDCVNLKSLSGMSQHTELAELKICQCGKIDTLSLGLLHCLKKLVLNDCGHLNSVTGLSDLTKLEELNISNCGKIEELSLIRLTHLKECFISEVPMLKRIEVKGCIYLEKVVGVLLNVVKLDIYDCPRLQKMAYQEKLYSRLQLFYCSKTTISNCIIDRKRLPSEVIKIIGRAVDGAESTLNTNLFWELNATNSVVKIGMEKTCNHLGRRAVGAIILCGVVRVNSCEAAKTMNEFMVEYDWSPWLKFEVRPGEWIVTSVTMREDEIKDYIVNQGCCFPFDCLALLEDVRVKTVSMPVMRGEQNKISNMLCTIVDKLYQS